MILLLKVYILIGLIVFMIEIHLSELEFKTTNRFWEGINPAIVILWFPKLVKTVICNLKDRNENCK